MRRSWILFSWRELPERTREIDRERARRHGWYRFCELLRKISRFRGAARRVSRRGVSPLARRSARPPRCLGARRLFLVSVIYSNLRDHDSYGGSSSCGWWVGSIRVRARCRWNIHGVPGSPHFPSDISRRTIEHSYLVSKSYVIRCRIIITRFLIRV